jgi:hypothetical protein
MARRIHVDRESGKRLLRLLASRIEASTAAKSSGGIRNVIVGEPLDMAYSKGGLLHPPILGVISQRRKAFLANRLQAGHE